MTCSSLPCRETLAEGVEFYSLRDDRFKTARLTAALLLPMKEPNRRRWRLASPSAPQRLRGLSDPYRP